MQLEEKIAVIGLGYVGLPLAVEFSRQGFQVVGFDIDLERIRDLENNNDRTGEVTSESLEQANSITFTTDPGLLDVAAIFIVTVPTPIDRAKKPDLGPLKSACTTVGKALSKGNIVIFESTVYPGCTEEICVPILEAESSLAFNKGFFCGYSPERINPGDKNRTISDIVKVTSGSTPAIANKIDALYGSIIKAGTHKASSIKVAEAAKVIENAQRDINIAFVNELSLIFERLDIDTKEVLDAAGTKWNFLPFTPGLVGGHCIGVDPYYLTHKAQSEGYHPEVILAGRRINDNMSTHVAQRVVKAMVKHDRPIKQSVVTILGITFKENCPDIRNSKVIDVIKELESYGVDIEVIDPLANPQEVKEVYGIELSQKISENSQALVLAVPHKLFEGVDWKSFHDKGTVIFDVKNFIDGKYVSDRL